MLHPLTSFGQETFASLMLNGSWDSMFPIPETAPSERWQTGMSRSCIDVSFVLPTWKGFALERPRAASLDRGFAAQQTGKGKQKIFALL